MVLWLAACSVSAADFRSAATNSIAEMSLEELLNVKITSVSKKEEKLNDAAAAISVLSNDDLRRSGVTSIAEALRLMHAAGAQARSRATRSRAHIHLTGRRWSFRT